MFRKLGASSAAFLLLALAEQADAGRYHVLYAFTGGNDGGEPYSTLVRDKAGNLYGTADIGGADSVGTVFKLPRGGAVEAVHTFTNSHGDGASPVGGIFIDRSSNLDGTTCYGGESGAGIVYSVAPSVTETILYQFTGGTDGGCPQAPLVQDSAGNLYGTTSRGGDLHCNDPIGCGAVFKLTAGGTESVLHAFAGNPDGARPLARLLADALGNLYGTTSEGGANDYGVVFKIAADGTETVLYSFTGRNDGGTPYSGVISDAKGNLYGTTAAGGTHREGVVYELAPDGKETVLYSFTGGSDGSNPYGGLVITKRYLYGTTSGGGNGGSRCGAPGCGTVFKLARNGVETVLHSFTGGRDGSAPWSGLVRDAKGMLYGTTSTGGGNGCSGPGCGTIFELPE